MDTKPFNLSDPLLPSTTEQPTAEEEEEQYPAITYNRGTRPLRDLPFLILFLILSLSTFVLGIIISARRNPNRSRASSFIYDPSSSSCIPPPISSPLLYLYSSSSVFVRDLIWTLVITLLLAGPIAISILFLLRNIAKQVVYTCIPFFILTLIFLNLYWFIACQFGVSCRRSFPLVYRIVVLVFIFLFIGLLIWIIVSNWHRVKLTARILGISASALASNIALFAVLPCLVVGLLVYFAPIVVFLVLGTFNGKIVPLESEDGGYFCKWKQAEWVPSYFALAIITMIWSLFCMVEVQAYVTSGTIARWYFSMEERKPRRSIRNSLRYE